MSEKYKIRSQRRAYFITFTTVYWIDVFTRQQYRDILVESLKYCQANKGLEVYARCFMSNHVHLIIGTNKAPMQDIVRDMKKYTSQQIVRTISENGKESRREWMLWMFERAGKGCGKKQRYQFWQAGYHSIELATNEMLDQKLDYIHNNPVEAGIVRAPHEYLYSSAKNYAEIGEYLLEVMFIR